MNQKHEVDPAIITALGVSPESCSIHKHGQAGFSESSKISAVINGEIKNFFLKTGLGGDMFAGEHESLQHLHSAVPSICPKSIAYGKLENSPAHFLLTEFLDMHDYKGGSGTGMSLAQKLAQLHSIPGPVPTGYAQPMFGFPVTTFCGSTPQNNAYRSSWAEFYAENRLLTIGKIIEERHGSDDELRTWIEKTAFEVVPKLLNASHLGQDRGILPVLVHGDLWSGNKGRGILGDSGLIEDVIFDPSSCYAHSEYEIGIMKMFGGFSASFFNEYHQFLPKTEPQNEYNDRVDLYQL